MPVRNDVSDADYDQLLSAVMQILDPESRRELVLFVTALENYETTTQVKIIRALRYVAEELASD